MSEGGGAPETTDGDRKLWFDYLCKLNDRAMSSKRESGATNWVLVAAAVAILYKCVPLLPWFLSIHGAFQASLVALLLEMDVVAFAGSAFVFVAHYAIGDPAARLLPEATKRARSVVMTIVRTMTLLLAALQLWTGIVFAGPVFVKWTLCGFGVLLLVNVVHGIVQEVRQTRKAGRKKTTFPEFGVSVGPDWVALVMAAVFSLLVVLPLRALWLHLRAVTNPSLGWVTCLSAASQTLVFMAVVLVLLFRIFYEGHRSAYLVLERSIVIENLSVAEIKSRFVTQLLGTEVAVWLEGIRSELERADAKLREAIQSVCRRVPDVEAVDESYPLERRGRAEELLRELESAVSECGASHEKGIFQLRGYLKLPIAISGEKLLESILRDLELSTAKTKESTSESRVMLERLRRLAAKGSPGCEPNARRATHEPRS